MSTIRVCDRCGAPAVDASNPLTFNMPASDPATLAVKTDVSLSIDVQTSKQDLCAPCLASALVEYTCLRLKVVLTPEVVATLGARIKAALS